MIRLVTSLLAVLFVLGATVSARAQDSVKPASRAEATAIIAEARRIVTPNGVERLEKVRIRDIEQWVSYFFGAAAGAGAGGGGAVAGGVDEFQMSRTISHLPPFLRRIST